VVRAHLAGRTAEARATLEGEFAERSRATVAALFGLRHALAAAVPATSAPAASVPQDSRPWDGRTERRSANRPRNVARLPVAKRSAEPRPAAGAESQRKAAGAEEGWEEF
jgi:hypothetical protein